MLLLMERADKTGTHIRATSAVAMNSGICDAERLFVLYCWDVILSSSWSTEESFTMILSPTSAWVDD